MRLTLRIRPLRVLLAVAAVVMAGFLFRGQLLRLFMRPEPPPEQERGISLDDTRPGEVTTIATGLDVPWSLAFLSEGGLLVTERSGRLVHIVDGERRAEVTVPGVRQGGESGLMGLALHPRFRENAWIYLAFTTEGSSGPENRLMRYRWTGTGLADARAIVDGIPAAMFHDGGQVAFGPDGYLYLTTGDATQGDLAQDRTSLAGKILRLTDDGGIPPDNPFGTRVYSWGHRNPQGLAWDDRGGLWSTEHGRSGPRRTGLDELNLIEPGSNYGWPLIEGDATGVGIETPVLHSGPDYTWAPAGAAYLDGSVFFGGLRGEALYEARLSDGAAPTLRAHFYGDFGRIRATIVGPDGMLYFTTSNGDGRGLVRAGDDRIVRVDPRVFRQ